MAYSVAHLCTAWRLLERGPRIDKPAQFLLGAVAPDAVHYRAGTYTSDWKLYAHLACPAPDIIPEKWGYITEIARWRDEILRYAAAAEAAGEDDRDFRLGYLVHILTDLCNATTVWGAFLKAQGGHFTRESYEGYGAECRATDAALLAEHPYRGELLRLLEQSEARGMMRNGNVLVSREEVEALRQVMLTRTLRTGEAPDVSRNRFAKREWLDALILQGAEVSRQQLGTR